MSWPPTPFRSMVWNSATASTAVILCPTSPDAFRNSDGVSLRSPSLSRAWQLAVVLSLAPCRVKVECKRAVGRPLYHLSISSNLSQS